MLRFNQSIATNRPDRPIPWVEKYRPKSMEDIVFQDEVVKTLKKSIETGNLPHLLFYGPPGTGKTSSILALASEIYGPEVKERVLELNASDERGIDVIRKRVKTFSGLVSKKATVNGKPCPPYKIIILDEADAMTVDAQNALRRTMETYSNVTRFCIICNYVSRIIQPITSRTAKFRFKPLQTEDVKTRLKYICEQENILVEDEVLNELYVLSGGDLRKAITYLQSCYQLYGNSFTLNNVNTISGVIPISIVEKFYNTCKDANFKDMKDYVADFVTDGYPAVSFLSQLNDYIVHIKTISDYQKALILECIGQSDKELVDGADEFMQLLNIASTIKKVSSQE